MSAGDDTLLERDAELALLHACLNRAAGGSGSVVVVEGAPGLGKTRLLDEATDAARERGFQVVTATASELERHFGFGVAISVLESVPRKPNRAHPLTLLKILGDGSGLDAVYALHRRLAELAEDQPLLVVIDDAHWADPVSLRWLLFAAQRAVEMPLAIVATVNPDVAGARYDLLARLGDDDQAQSAVLQPLSAPGSAALVERRIRGASRAVTDACYAATGGSPLLLELLLDELARSGAGGDEQAAAHAAAAGAETLLHGALEHLHGLSAPAVALARAVAVLGVNASRYHATRLAGLDPEEAVAASRTLVDASVFGSSDPLRFRHPLVRNAVYTAIPEAQRGDLHAEAAQLLAQDDVPAPRSAGHLLVGSRRGWGEGVNLLRAAAADAIGQGNPDSAVVFLERALDEPPDATTAPEVLMELGEAEALTGSERVVEHLEQALELRGDAITRAETLARLGAHLTEMGQHPRAREMFARALQEPDLPPPMTATLRTAEYSIALTDGSLGVEDLERLLDVSQSTARDASGPASGAALTQLAVAHVFTSRDAAGARDLALRGLAEMAGDSGASLYASSIALSCLIWCEELDVVEEAIAGAMEDARRRGAMMSLAYLSLGRSWTNYWRGRIGRAAGDAGLAVDAWSGGWSMHLPIAAAWQALALIELDRPAEAVALIERVLSSRTRDADLSGAWLPHHEPLLLHARGRAELALGNTMAAVRSLKDVAAQQSPFTHNPAVLSWRSDAAIACSRAGDADTARDLAREEMDLATRFGSPRPIGVALRATALVEGDDNAVPLLTEAVQTLERSPARIELLRALVDLGAALATSGDRVAARQVLTRAMGMDDTTTAVALRRRAASRLASLGI